MAIFTKPNLALRQVGSLHPEIGRTDARQLWLPATLVFFITFVLYWLTPTQFNTFDAVSYANQIAHQYPETHDLHWLFHPHHLLFNAVGYGLWRTAQFFGYHGGPLPVLERLNAACGAVGITLFYLTLRSLLQRSRGLPVLAAFGLSLSFGYWICATDGRVNMPSLTLLIGALFVLCRVIEKPTPKLAAILGGLGGAAVLFHESAGLFLLVGLVGVLLAGKMPGTERRKLLLIYVGVWAATVILPYLLIGTLSLGLHSPGAFRRWASEYAELGWWWDFRILHNLRLDAYALRKAAFVEPPGKEGTFHLSHSTPLDLRVLYFTTLAGWLAGVYAFGAALPLLWRSHHKPILICCLTWIGIFGAFFTVWTPSYFIFKTLLVIPITVLLTLALAHWRARWGESWTNSLVGFWIALYALVNWTASIAPHLQADASPFYRTAVEIKTHTQPGDIVAVSGSGDGAQNEVDIPYFADRKVVSLHTTLERAHEDKGRAWAVAQDQIDTALGSGHAVYALDEIWHNTHTFMALQARHPEVGRTDITELFAPYQRTLAWETAHGPVWRLTPKAIPAPPQTSIVP